MALDIGSAITDGAKRTFKKNGLIIAGIFFAISILSTVASSSLIQAFIDEGVIPSEYAVAEVPLALGISSTASGILLAATFVLSAVFALASLRTLVSSETETIPVEYFTRNIGWALLNLLVGGIAFSIALLFGLAAFIIPGLFILVSLYFWNVFVIVEDQNFIEAFKSSWNLTEGNRLELFGLGVIVVFIALLASLAGNIVSWIFQLIGVPGVSMIVELIPNSFVSTFSIATLAQAYNQLKE